MWSETACETEKPKTTTTINQGEKAGEERLAYRVLEHTTKTTSQTMKIIKQEQKRPKTRQEF